MSEAFQPAPEEVFGEFARVSTRLQDTFPIFETPETDIIDQWFGDRGLNFFPTILIPNTRRAYEGVREIVGESQYPNSFLPAILRADTDLTDIARPGAALCSAALRLNVIVDLHEDWSYACGDDAAWHYTNNAQAHEKAHGMFQQDRLLVATGVGNTVEKILEESSLTGNTRCIYGDENYRFEPVWIDEAIASYTAGQTLKMEYNLGRSEQPFSSENGGIYTVAEQYVLRSEDSPDFPGRVGGAIAGQTLENLDAKAPGVIDDIFGVARGEVDAVQFRNDLAARVGPELFKLMFEPRPESTWISIYRRVGHL